ncbi:MAG: PadR family transcriptional regulator [Gemmatimonadetes bacterium]|nr:PadR family transcriptional regulator [Gemmatimonadota bacterium]
MTRPASMKTNWFHILLAVADAPLHGYGIRQEVAERTGGTVTLWPGVLYRSLKALMELGWIRESDPPDDAPADARRRRFYAVTPSGLEALGREAGRMNAYLQAARDKGVPFRHV